MPGSSGLPSARKMANRRLSKEILTIHHEVNGIFGHRHIKAEFAAMGHVCVGSAPGRSPDARSRTACSFA